MKIASPLQRYGAAFAIALGAIALALALFPEPTAGFYILPVAAIALSAWIAGAAPGIFATFVTLLLCVLLASGGHASGEQILPPIIFAIVGLGLSLLGARTRRSLDRGALDGRTYRAIMADAVNGIIFTDERGRIIEAGSGAERMLGYDAGRLVGIDIATLLEREDAATLAAGLVEIRAGRPARARWRMRCADGTAIVVQAVGQRMTDGSLLTILQDVTDSAQVEAALRDSELRLRLMTEVMPHIAWCADPAGEISFVNARWTEYTGLGARVSAGGGWVDVLHPEDRTRILRSWRSAIAGGDEFRQEARLRSVTGEYRWYLLMGRPHRDDAGAIVQWYGTGTDIDELKRVEDELASQRDRAELERARLSAVLGALPVGVFIADATGRLAETNDAANELWGGAPRIESAEGYATYKGWSTATGERLEGKDWGLARALEGQSVDDQEVEIERFDGTRRTILNYARPVVTISGRPLGAVAMSIDISDRRRSEQQMATLLLREQQARAQAEEAMKRTSFLARAGEILASSLVHDRAAQGLADLIVPEFADLCAIFLVNTDDELRIGGLRHRDVNRERELRASFATSGPLMQRGLGAVGRVLRSGRAEVHSGGDAIDAAHADYPEDIRALLRQAGFRSLLALPLEARGDLLGVIALITDSASQRMLEGDSVDFALELARRASIALDNARLYAEAERANQAKDRFLAMLSHELRTPLTPTLAAVEALAEDDLPEASRPLVDIIRRNVELESRLIDDLLDLTRIIKGKLLLHLETVDLNALIRNVVDICRSDLALRQLVISVSLEAQRHHVSGDPARLQQILWNLLKNAIKFTPDGGRIALRATCDEEKLIVEVADNGIGIDAALLPVIFNAFEQAEQPPGSRAGGLGLGLAISRSLALMHGGELTAASAGLGRGATFTLRLPLVAAPEPVAPSVPEGATQPSVADGSCRILVVDDHKETTRVMRLLLERRGYTVETAFSEDAAFEAAAGGGFDLLISDIDLRGGSGINLLRRLRERRPMRAIAISGFGTEEDVARSREAGFAIHLVKPFSASRLHESIEVALADRAS